MISTQNEYTTYSSHFNYKICLKIICLTFFSEDERFPLSGRSMCYSTGCDRKSIANSHIAEFSFNKISESQKLIKVLQQILGSNIICYVHF